MRVILVILILLVSISAGQGQERRPRVYQPSPTRERIFRPQPPSGAKTFIWFGHYPCWQGPSKTHHEPGGFSWTEASFVVQCSDPITAEDFCWPAKTCTLIDFTQSGPASKIVAGNDQAIRLDQ